MAAARVIVHSLRTSEWSGELDSVFLGGRWCVLLVVLTQAFVRIATSCSPPHTWEDEFHSCTYSNTYVAVYLHPISKRYIIGPVFFQYQAQIHVERKTVLKEYKTGSVTHVARCLFLVRYAVISWRPGLISYQEMTPSRDHESLRT